MATAPLRYADTVPYELPTSLGALRGPTGGLVEVDTNIDTAPLRVYDLGKPGRVYSLYQATVRDGYTHQQEAILNRETLLRLWRELWLPPRCRAAWEAKFPELAEL
jgi:hypothetical protein